MGWQSVLAVAIGGGLGSLLRYGITFALSQRLGPGFPWWTFAINVSGSFAIGVIGEITQTRAFYGSPALRLFLMTGVLGGYTTFSTFSYEGLTLFDGAAFLAIAYIVGSVVAGLIAAFLGVVLARAFSAA